MRERRIKQPIVSITQGDSEQQSIRKALDLLPINEMIKTGDKVVITPNWVNPKPPSSGVIVGPETLRELIRYVKQFQPGEIIIATGSGGADTKTMLVKFGYDRIIKDEQVGFIDLNYGPYMELELDDNIIKKTKINKLLLELDVLISFTQLKQHEEGTISAAIKNIALGWPPAEIHGFPKKNLGIHDDLHGFITAMAKKIPIDLSIVSADKAMIGTGPSNGIPVDTDGLIIAATDPIAADTIGARFLGFLPQGIHYLYMLSKGGFGESDPKKMTIKGMTLVEAERCFSRAAYGQEIAMDKAK
ncbi:MAG: hypothetical protein K0S76_289 [Herbinix sp.]|jgi:uncharacterized protein (DUF362 family)|nr:hypothetical protein [Herbinix sp.]